MDRGHGLLHFLVDRFAVDMDIRVDIGHNMNVLVDFYGLVDLGFEIVRRQRGSGRDCGRG